MTETTYALCKSAPGVLMWLVGLCASNQALDQPYVDLSTQGTLLKQEISVPMDERYELGLTFRFKDQQAYENSAVSGRPSGAHHVACNDSKLHAALLPSEKRETGAELDVEVSVASINGQELKKARFQSRCAVSWGSLTIHRQFGTLLLPKGTYLLTVSNLSPVAREPGVQTTLSLTGSGAGYP
jgi:hypothetical protein